MAQTYTRKPRFIFRLLNLKLMDLVSDQNRWFRTVHAFITGRIGQNNPTLASKKNTLCFYFSTLDIIQSFTVLDVD